MHEEDTLRELARRATAGPKVRRVLVATDLSAHSPLVAAYACAIACRGGIVRLVHVVHPRSISAGAFETDLGRRDRHEQYRRAMEERLEALRCGVARPRGVRIQAAVVEDENAVRGVCREADRFGADVIATGSRGEGLSKALLGSVARGILAKCGRPALVVEPPEARDRRARRNA